MNHPFCPKFNQAELGYNDESSFAESKLHQRHFSLLKTILYPNNMAFKTRLPYVVLALLLATNVVSGQQTQTPTVDFNRDIKPLLSDRCYFCHGPDEASREAGLRLDVEEEAHNAIEVGSAEDSELYLRIISDDDDQMPPKGSKLSLKPEEIERIKRWINEGAKFEQHWAFVAPKNHPTPKTNKPDWIRNEIDAFVLGRLESEKIDPALFPAAQASKEKLLRRISFDLTGLPPTLAELDTFLADNSPDAYAKAVDRLLDSPRYGERMASDWLDLARYSDTYGYQVDRDRYVWPWRDWVVRAFNRNMPYDQFLTEQLAGDLLPKATDDQILATTFNRLHPQKVEGGSIEEEFRVEYVADRSQTVGMAFLGLTVECARCHDHKYDPISTKEYYQLFSFFNNVDEAGLYSYFDASAVPTPSLLLMDDAKKQELAELKESIASAERTAYDNSEKHIKAFEAWLTETRKTVPAEIHPEIHLADFEKTKNARNELVDGPAGTKALKLTGDDEVRLDTGKFTRHQPFTIATQINIPNDEKLLKRAVIFHRSRAWTDSASRGYQLLVKDGHLHASLIHFWPGNAISVRATEPVATEKWQRIAMSYDGSSRAAGIKLFVDGKPASVEIVRDNLQKTIIGNGTSHLILGARFRDVGLKNGQLADFRVFDRELSVLEVAHLSGGSGLKTLLDKPTAQLNDTEKESLREFFFRTQYETHRSNLKSLADARMKHNSAVDKVAEIMVMRELPKPRPAFVLDRGSYDSPTDPVSANTPEVFPPMPAGQPRNRLGLAKWLCADEHPLTARVAVNHYWQLLLGEGLVRTPEDFGSQGEPPTHPKLLDTLAVDFQSNGWDVKRLLKKIVMSNTYRQSTRTSNEMRRLDPDNRLLARVSSFRLPAEMLRDNVLATSGLLVDKMGGPPARPYELAASFKPSTPDKGDGLYRRSLYTYWKRTGPAPVMLTLDSAKRDVCQVQRERTSSPLAALVQLNNPQTVEASRQLAHQLMAQHDDELDKIVGDLFRTLTSRFPTEKESSILTTLYEQQFKRFAQNPEAAKELLDVGETKTESDNPARLAALTAVVNTLFSFDECVMKR